jgi:glycosyltransferase involved in cell wall biosynthesis
MDADEPLVSVVTPVRNGEKYLRECIESVLAQTYRNWEYVIVENCSTDRTLEIAREYAERDARIRLHQNDTCLGMLANWNHALRQISPESKYCKVVHADDWLFPECLEFMVDLAERHPSVGIVGAYRIDEDHVNLDDLPFPHTVVSGRYVCRRRFLGGHDVFGSPTSLMMRADLVRQRHDFYDESNIHADTEVCFDLLRSVEFGQVHRVLTYTRRHNETASSYCRRLDTHRVGRLIILKKYGRDYLDEEEYQRVLKRHLRHYYRFLGRNVARLRDAEFRDFHVRSLRDLHEPLRIPRLAGSTIAAWLNLGLSRLRI